MSSARKKATAKEDIDVRIIGDGNRDWAVISMLGHFRFDEECPCVIYSGLKTREAAEVAARDALAGLDDETHRCPYGPSEVPIKYFNAVGRVVRELRKANVDDGDVIALAVNIWEAAANGDGLGDCDDELPF